MADAPWRCSQCGTVNEPVANACRTCGRWPSLFELEGSTIETEDSVVAKDEFAAETVDVEEVEPEVFEPGGLPDGNGMPPEFEADEELEAERPRWRVLARLIVPIGVVVYILVSALVDR
ncbi:MAG TPA: hypothetical protein VFT94_01675 [Gaiellaceae bacterium]|nr:hypothetical protein [Gaiellaceae bacterium]